MFCQKCGNQLNEGAAFCPKCGTRVGEPKVNTVNQQPVTPRQTIPVNNTAKDTKSNNMTTFLVIGGVAAVILIVAAIGLYDSSTKSAASIAAPAAAPAAESNNSDDTSTGDDYWDTSVLDDAKVILHEFANDTNSTAVSESDKWDFAWWCESTSGDPILYVIIRPGENMTEARRTVQMLNGKGMGDLFRDNFINVKYVFIDKSNQFMAAYDENNNEISMPSDFDDLVEEARVAWGEIGRAWE